LIPSRGCCGERNLCGFPNRDCPTSRRLCETWDFILARRPGYGFSTISPNKPLMVPSSVAKRNTEAHPFTLNSLEPLGSEVTLKTIPVGEPGPLSPFGESGPFPAVGIDTLRPVIGFPAPSYSVDQPQLLSLIHHGVPGP